MMHNDKFFSVNIGRLRRENGLSQAELAEKAGVSHHTIFRAESKGMIPLRKNISKIARALGVPETDLFTDPATINAPEIVETPANPDSEILQQLKILEAKIDKNGPSLSPEQKELVDLVVRLEPGDVATFTRLLRRRLAGYARQSQYLRKSK